MNRAGAGLDRQALEALYIRLEKPLYNAVYRWVWSAEEARDVVQDAFVRLWRMRDRVRVDSVEPLLWRIALNQASNRRRARKRWGWLPLVGERRSSRAGPDDELALDERERRLRAAVEALPEHLRRVVMLCTWSELSYAQIAEMLDIPPGTVASRKNTAIKKLRATMEAADV